MAEVFARFVFDNWLNLRTASIVRNAPTIATAIDEFSQAIDLSILVNVVLTVLGSIGAVVLVLVIFRVEVRAAAEYRETRAAAAGLGGEGLMLIAATSALAPQAETPPRPWRESSPGGGRRRGVRARTVGDPSRRCRHPHGRGRSSA